MVDAVVTSRRLPVVEGVAPDVVARALDLSQDRPQIGMPALREAFPQLGQRAARQLARALKVYRGLNPSSPAARSAAVLGDPAQPQPGDDVTEPPVTVNVTAERLDASGCCDDASIEVFLRLINFDDTRWRVVNAQVRRWSSAVMKLRTKTGDDLIDEPYEPPPRWYHKVTAAPLVHPSVVEAVERLTERLAVQAPKRKPIPRTAAAGESYLLEIGLHDVHLGMRAWGEECGEDFDVQIARDYVARAVDDILAKARGRHVGRILLPIGSDFFHLDNAEGVTNRSRNRLDIDTRPAYVFEAGVMCMVDTIDRCREVAPVEAVYLPANHDITWAHHLAVCLRQHYRNDPEVTIDVAPTPRKYRQWGVCMLGLTHGDCARGNWKVLPTLMASEAPDMWSATWYREIHTGHVHHLEVDEIAGIPVRRLPTLTPADAYHAFEAYTRIQRVLEAFWWGDRCGLDEISYAHARRPDGTLARRAA